MKLYAQLSSKGQVVIPAEIREQCSLEPGTRMAVEVKDNCIILRPLTDAFIESLPGSLKGPSLSAIRDREHRDDEERR